MVQNQKLDYEAAARDLLMHQWSKKAEKNAAKVRRSEMGSRRREKETNLEDKENIKE